MTPDQARKLRISAEFLASYFRSDSQADDLLASDDDFVDLIDGNFLLADAVAQILARVRRVPFDQVLDELPERDEGWIDDPETSVPSSVVSH